MGNRVAYMLLGIAGSGLVGVCFLILLSGISLSPNPLPAIAIGLPSILLIGAVTGLFASIPKLHGCWVPLISSMAWIIAWGGLAAILVRSSVTREEFLGIPIGVGILASLSIMLVFVLTEGVVSRIVNRTKRS